MEVIIVEIRREGKREARTGTITEGLVAEPLPGEGGEESDLPGVLDVEEPSETAGHVESFYLFEGEPHLAQQGVGGGVDGGLGPDHVVDVRLGDVEGFSGGALFRFG